MNRNAHINKVAWPPDSEKVELWEIYAVIAHATAAPPVFICDARDIKMGETAGK